MNTRWLLASVVAASVPAGLNFPRQVCAQTPATLPATQTSTDTASLRLRALQPVLDAHERRQDWHQAADAAAARVDSEPLKKELIRRLAGLAPRVAKALTAQPHDDALVTVAVYREPGLDGKQAMVAVTFDGMGSDVGPDLFADILADLPTAPQAKQAPGKFVLDRQATSYLVFFLDRDGLKASDVPHDKMKQGVMLAINRQHEEAARSAIAARQENQAAEAAAANQQSPDLSRAQQAAAAQAAGGAYPPVGPGYTYPIPEMLNDGYGYPGIGVPIVILPSGTVAQPPNNQGNGSQPHGTQELNQKRQRFPGPGEPGGAPAGSKSAGVNQPAGSAGTKQPAGSAGVNQPPGSAGARQPAGRSGQESSSSNAERPERAPAPPPREAPKSESTGGSPPVQGKAPAQSGGQGQTSK